METHLADWLRDTPEGVEAESILRSCVHCGFCTATCPTYQLLGDELDGPRGRIYLMKQVMEGVEPTRETQLHLDRCLTCRNCESTCPSGVRYGHLVDIGRRLVEARVERPLGERLLRGALREGLTRRRLFDPAMRVGQALRPLLPDALKSKVPERRDAGRWPGRAHERKVLMLAGCVQPAMAPSIDAATARVLDALEIEAVVAERSGCCGAIRHHLNDHDGGLADVRRNVDAWWPWIEGGRAEAIVINASGCGTMIADYGHLLRDDPAYAAKGARVSALATDLSVFLAREIERLAELVREVDGAAPRVAFHPPCTLQHGQQVRGAVESLLAACGATLVPFAESHLCCGSAGTYSVTQPELSRRLRERKLENIEAGSPEAILSANIGCVTHLQAGTGTPVRHWIEWVDARLAPAHA
ncbi:MAG TPA: glycolate oxidase subunit GlcF [Burkholderiaceae bacterium]|nr:glycolate oxidase subunit GlcF [Burkholderiaceae bacterium]